MIWDKESAFLSTVHQGVTIYVLLKSTEGKLTVLSASLKQHLQVPGSQRYSLFLGKVTSLVDLMVHLFWKRGGVPYTHSQPLF